ncbi:MAG TPA: hypothetical protein VF377_08745 [Acidimicrobiia bacterium]
MTLISLDARVAAIEELLDTLVPAVSIIADLQGYELTARNVSKAWNEYHEATSELDADLDHFNPGGTD